MVVAAVGVSGATSLNAARSVAVLSRRVRRAFAPFSPTAPRTALERTARLLSASTATAPEATSSAPTPFRAHLDFKSIRDNVDLHVQNSAVRNSLANPKRVAELYDQCLSARAAVERVRSERNENSTAMKGKLDPEVRQELIRKGQELKEQLAVMEATLSGLEAELQREGQRIPNLTHPDVPIGGEEVATCISEIGSPRDFMFPPKDHIALAEALDLVDFDSAGEVSGSKFYYLRNAAALMEMALVQWTLMKVVSKGFTPIMTPDLVRENVLEKCGFQPRGDNTQVYSVRDSDLCLTGTAEVPLGGIYMDKILEEASLPIKMVAFGHCFRTEAGAAGAAGKGLYRVHQFSKVEMFVVSTPEQSDALHQELIGIEEELYTELGLHFKVLDMPSGDLGAPAYRKFDVEAWMPGLKRYGEISSASNCTDYQSRRLNIRYRPKPQAAEADAGGDKKGKGKKSAKASKTEFVHTLNATACAVPRLLVAILENNQQEDGSVVVPEVLRPYLGGLEVITSPGAMQEKLRGCL